MFKKILVALDGSLPSTRALEAACGLVRAFDAELHLVHARENRTLEVMPGGAAWTDNHDSDGPVLATARTLLEKAGITPASVNLGEGEPFEEIMTIAELYSVDLIIMGRRGLGNLQGLLAGSTTQKISHEARCAVLTVK